MFPAKSRSTDECIQMNVVYDGLRLGSPGQLAVLRAEAVIRYLSTGDKYYRLFIGQIDETIRRKFAGIW